MFVKAFPGKNKSVFYIDSDGNTTILKGGSMNWRTHNPGSIRSYPFARKMGSIGEYNGFAIFPDYTTGKNALAALLKSPKYASKSLKVMLNRFAPPSENNTFHYQELLEKITGIDINTKISDLQDEDFNKVLLAIERIEGFKKGSIHQVVQNNYSQEHEVNWFEYLQNHVKKVFFTDSPI